MSSPTSATSPPPWRDVRILRWVFQVVVVGLIVLVLAWLWGNYTSRPQGEFNFDFLDQPTGFEITGNTLPQNAPISDALYEGFLNTMRVVVAGIVCATVLGTIVGIARLSSNWLLRKVATVYVEMIRNVPLLIVIFFASQTLILQVLPVKQDAWNPFGLLVMSVNGVGAPWYEGSGYGLLIVLAVAIAAAWLVARWRRTVSERSGVLPRTGLFGGAALVLVAVVGWLVVGVSATFPDKNIDTISGFTGGIRLDPSFFALFVGLTVYTSSHIAEIVRGSIQAVPKGQGEAAEALALNGFQRLWYVVLPQAFRIAIPPLGNQYLNLLKNSSLGAAFSYYETTLIIKTAVGNGRPAVPAYAVLLAMYIVIGLAVSILVNIANRRMRLVTR